MPCVREPGAAASGARLRRRLRAGSLVGGPARASETGRERHAHGPRTDQPQLDAAVRRRALAAVAFDAALVAGVLDEQFGANLLDIDAGPQVDRRVGRDRGLADRGVE